MRPEVSAPSYGYFFAHCHYSPVFQKGSKAAFLCDVIFTRKSSRKFVPYPNWSSFLVIAGPTSAGRVSNSLLRKFHPRPGKNFNPLLWLDTRGPCYWKGLSPCRAQPRPTMLRSSALEEALFCCPVLTAHKNYPELPCW